MKFITSIFVIAILLISIDAQEPPKPKLVDEFGLIVCGNLHARTDGFAEEIKRDPTSNALIVIYPPTVRPDEQAERHRRRISSTLQNRGLDVDRFQFYKAKRSPDGQIRTEFWKSSASPPTKAATAPRSPR